MADLFSEIDKTTAVVDDDPLPTKGPIIKKDRYIEVNYLSQSAIQKLNKTNTVEFSKGIYFIYY